jgi:hypothetical protein
LRVVGQTVLPEFGDAGQLGTGSLMTLQGLDRLLPSAPVNLFLVQFARSADAGAENTRIARAVAPIPVHFQARPEDLIELSHGGGLLLVLVVLLSGLALALVLHALLTSVRARAREFGVLRALGFVGRQMRATILWQVVTLVAGALVIGWPLGCLVGRSVWLAFAHQLGVAPDGTFPAVPTFVLVGAGALGLALVAAIVPGMIAVRTRSTSMLHSE